MFEINTQILINAPLEAVWDCLADTHHYSDWNQFIRKIEGDFIQHNIIKINIVAPDGQNMNFTPTCLVVKKNQEIRWVGKMGFDWIFRGEHYFLLEKINNEQTKFIHGEKFTGLIALLFKKLRGDVTQKGFELMNQNLADYVVKTLNSNT